MAVLQADDEAMLIVNNNEEAKSYLANIPSEYQEVERIWASWSQYINTWFKFTEATWWIAIKYSPTSLWNNQSHRLGWAYLNNARSFVMYFGDTTQRLWVGTGDHITWFTLSTNQTYEFEATISTAWSCSFSQNWTSWNLSYSWTIVSWLNIFLFCNDESWTPNEYRYWKVYYYKIWEAGVLKRDFYACYRKSDNVIGLYDKVEGVFYPNSWSWTFSKWDNYKR